MRRCGLYIRVSTLRQADVKEGSLKNQEYLLRQQIKYRNSLGGDKWEVRELYKEEGRSAKNTTERPEFLRMMADVKAGLFDTVMVTALSRISRSTRDLLEMIETFKHYGVDFVSLKEDFDTTTAQGKCFVTIVAALNEFEREQTSERNRASALARAERGLWTGGKILGFDIPEEKDQKGRLVKNEREAEVVNFCFDSYIDCGSILTTCRIVNGKGYRTKEYMTKTGKLRAARKFAYTSMHNILNCYAYIGKVEVNKRKKNQDQEKLAEEDRYRLVEAVWEGIVPEEKFQKAQNLIRRNDRHKTNGVRPVKHNYLLNGGLLHCQVCGSFMKGTCGTGKFQKKYYYYICSNRGCRFKVPADEIEGALLGRISELAGSGVFMEKLVQENNDRLRALLPDLQKRRRLQLAELEGVKGKAKTIMERYLGEVEGPGAVFIQEELNSLGRKREEIEESIRELAADIERIERRSVDKDLMRLGLRRFDESFAKIKPYEQKELMRIFFGRVELGERSIRIGFRNVGGEVDRIFAQKRNVSEHGLTRALRHPSSDPDGNRTRVAGLKGLSPNRWTTGS